MPDQDFETIALGLKVQPNKKVIQPNQHIPLTAAEMTILSQATTSPFYAVLLKVMEGVAQKLETEHMRHYKDKELFDRTGMIAVAAQLFFEAIQKEVIYQVAEYAGQIDLMAKETEAAQMSPEDYIRKEFGA